MSDAAVVLVFMSLLYLFIGFMTCLTAYEVTDKEGYDDEQRNILFARTVLASVFWPLLWVGVFLYLLVRGVGFMLRYVFKPLKPRNHDGMSPFNAPQVKIDLADERARAVLDKLEDK